MPTAEEKRILGVLRKSAALSEAPVESLHKLMAGAQFATYRPARWFTCPATARRAFTSSATGGSRSPRSPATARS